MDDPGDGLYRAALCGERGELALGVLAPEDGRLALRRRLYTRDAAAIGRPLRGEARCSFRFQEDCWRETCCPAQMFQGGFLQSRLEPIGLAWWRREDGLLRLALPVEDLRPFPLESLFCLAKLEQVGGRLCAVYTFRDGEPLP